MQVILFDAVGTLLRPDPPVAVAYQRLGRQFGSGLSAAEIERRFRIAFARQEALDQAGGNRTDERRELERWRTIVREVFTDIVDSSGLFAGLWEHFAQPQHWTLYPDVADCWRRLAGRGLVLGVASNFDARLEGICRGIELLADCPWVFTSSRLGHRKPSPGFFQAVEQALALPAENLVLVGDDLDSDFHAARAAGWQAVLLARAPALDSTERPTIASLAQLPELIGALC